jgi:hypothetical protein
MKKIIILISAIILCTLLLTCNTVEQTVKLKIYYSADGFNGFYVADAGNAVLMDIGTVGDSGNIYQVDVDMNTSLKVQITSKSLTNSLTVLIYKDDVLVKDGSSTGDGYSAASITLLYEYDSTATTTTTTTN